MLARTDPLRDLDRLFEELRGRGSTRFIPLDAYRRGDVLFVHFDLPGVDPASIEVTMEDDVLTVKAQRVWEEEPGDELVACERPQGTFERQISLSDDLDRERLGAHYDRGVLTVRLPVREVARSHRIPVVTVADAPSVSGGSHPLPTP